MTDPAHDSNTSHLNQNPTQPNPNPGPPDPYSVQPASTASHPDRSNAEWRDPRISHEAPQSPKEADWGTARARVPYPSQSHREGWDGAQSSIDPDTDENPSQHRRSLALRWLTYLLFIPLMTASTVFFGCISLLCGLWDRSGRQQHAIASVWGRSLLRITFSPVTIIGAEKLNHHPVAVYASNHLSYMDTPVLFAKLPFQFRIFAKSSLWKLPFIGWYLHRSGQVPIDGKSSRTAIAGLLRGVATIKSGLSLVLFPEAGRSEGGELKTMMPGCAFMAIRAGVPLVPIALIGTYELLPIHVYHLAPRPLKLIVGDPISTDLLTTRDADALTGQLYEAISLLYNQHS